ncbi:DUF2971 domain-containing protein [Stenotrophomonas sp. S48]|uniref:DUF2971 domain-containing protein n=1 Tax=unclassified Stenotrophomonas TaxID=196198 RepID=UPI0018FFA71B|nr:MULTISPECIES: DUF2971 domain-containing protein [unclassified Stenotrophomonas]MBK0026982.1 DUF2971 domain-containing protein [Stenotrophomonas sp. S48]MBK0048577.1 DUF2971 domain-containing protein [Stenotrophomonas sp. S49]
MKILYKYRALSERTSEIIRKKKVWLAKPSSLNDPNECRFEPPDPAQVRKVVADVKNAQLAGFIADAALAQKDGRSFFTLRGRAINRLLSRIKKSSGLDKKHKVAQGFLKEVGTPGFSDPYDQPNSIDRIVERVGIFSLSEDPLNMLMWSHYGDSHKGVALGFAASTGSRLADPKFCQSVRYEDGAMAFDFSVGRLTGVAVIRDPNGTMRTEGYVQIDDRQIQNALFTKTTDWAYEKEWRYYEPTFGEYDHPGELVEVIFGLNLPLKEQEEFALLCRESLGDSVTFRCVTRPNGTQKLELRDAAA